MVSEKASCVRSAALAQGWLHDALTVQGPSTAEVTEMATHWLPMMIAQPWVLVSFVPPSELDKLAPLTFALPPQNLLRVFMLFSPVSAPPPGARA